MQTQNCPLCGDDAHFHVTQDPGGKRFNCPACTRFFIDEGSERHLENLPEVTRTERRQQLSRMAKATANGELLVIRKPSHDETHTGIKNQTRTMIAEYVSA